PLWWSIAGQGRGPSGFVLVSQLRLGAPSFSTSRWSGLREILLEPHPPSSTSGKEARGPSCERLAVEHGASRRSPLQFRPRILPLPLGSSGSYCR
ncbi:hypothetical protein FOZ62_022336, partial [Perkinsus olseni]